MRRRAQGEPGMERIVKQGIIFDMDGTLWDSAANVAESWNVAIEKSRLTDRHLTEADIKGVMGKTMDVIADVLFPDVEEKPRRELLAACCEVPKILKFEELPEVAEAYFGKAGRNM